jgi:hypothetical protein
MTDNNTIELHFRHPRDSGQALTADLSPQCTGQEALEELLRNEDGNGAFLPPLPGDQAYNLSVHRTKQEIAASMTFAQAGVVNGDTIDVGQSAPGATEESDEQGLVAGR